MKAEELRIGDWVAYFGDTEGDNPVKIEGMDIAGNTLITSDREDVGFDGIQPLRLTEKIMMKNFPSRETDDEIGWWQNHDCTFFVTYKSDITEIEAKAVRYVHELQHILSVVGIEKEVEL